MNFRYSLLYVTPALALFALLSSCTGVNTGVFLGVLPNTNPAKEYAFPYGFYKGGVLVHKHSTTGQIGNAAGLKKGAEACTYAVAHLIAFGDSSIDTAKRNGGITRVASVEYSTVAFLSWVLHMQCTVVTGE